MCLGGGLSVRVRVMGLLAARQMCTQMGRQ